MNYCVCWWCKNDESFHADPAKQRCSICWPSVSAAARLRATSKSTAVPVGTHSNIMQCTSSKVQDSRQLNSIPWNWVDCWFLHGRGYAIWHDDRVWNIRLCCCAHSPARNLGCWRGKANLQCDLCLSSLDLTFAYACMYEFNVLVLKLIDLYSCLGWPSARRSGLGTFSRRESRVDKSGLNLITSVLFPAITSFHCLRCSRVSLGIELLKKPTILFCLRLRIRWSSFRCRDFLLLQGDEPTSGLDSASAYKVTT